MNSEICGCFVYKDENENIIKLTSEMMTTRQEHTQNDNYVVIDATKNGSGTNKFISIGIGIMSR